MGEHGCGRRTYRKLATKAAFALPAQAARLAAAGGPSTENSRLKRRSRCPRQLPDFSKTKSNAQKLCGQFGMGMHATHHYPSGPETAFIMSNALTSAKWWYAECNAKLSGVVFP